LLRLEQRPAVRVRDAGKKKKERAGEGREGGKRGERIKVISRMYTWFVRLSSRAVILLRPKNRKRKERKKKSTGGEKKGGKAFSSSVNSLRSLPINLACLVQRKEGKKGKGRKMGNAHWGGREGKKRTVASSDPSKFPR